ncbi:hypothetical protein V493_00017 [Pseudogymnoascus sp. VKM F-4281 (FW-2241)]|nr:hypothetical protein V493_00017 [Pseudogymnoascus sp. VKM F-4281 (FW-2241)]
MKISAATIALIVGFAAAAPAVEPVAGAVLEETVKANGLNIWSTGAPPGSTTEVDIVGVQGLGSHPFFTWVNKVQDPESKPTRKLVEKLWTRKDKTTPKQDGQIRPQEFMWPRDLLVPLFTNARVATYSYKSGQGVKTTLRQLAEQFLNILSQHRQKPDERQRPLILIGHSLGGLVIQQALVIAALNRDFRELRLSVAGVIFLGTPFQGSNAAVLGKRLAQVTGGDLSLLELLQKDNPNLHALAKDFCDSHHEWDFVCFYEDTDADFTLLKTRVVTASSATLSGRRMIFLNTDHSGLNKFSGENDENYALLLPEIQRMVDKGRSVVTSRHQSKEGEAAGNKHWLVPRGVNKLFTGRSEIIDRIKGAILNDSAQHADKQKVFVITGLGGMGKSEICLQIANELREEFWGVFWVDVDSESNAKSDFISAAAAFEPPAESIDDVRRLFASTERSWLLILDNADDPEVDYQAYLPSGSRGVVIMTSRVSDCSQYNTVGSEELTSLDIGLSKQLLLRAADIAEELWPSVDQQAEDIANLIGSHTLALIQAGTYIAKGYSRLDQYPEVYVKHRKRLLEYRPSQARSRYGDVYATFEASAHVLEKSESEDAKDALCLLGILSMLHSSALPLQMFEHAWESSKAALDISDADGDLETLCRWHALQLPEFIGMEADEWDSYRLNKASNLLVSLSFVVRSNPAEGSPLLSMHPLAHAWAKDRQELGKQRKTWVAAACIVSLSINDYGEHRDLLLHLQSFLNNTEVKRAFSLGPISMVTTIFIKCGWNLNVNRDDYRLSNLLQDIFDTVAITCDEPSMEYLPVYDLYARNLNHTGDIRNALELQIQIVNLLESVLPIAHPDRLASQHQLADAYLKMGKVEKATELLEYVVKIREEALPINHPSRLASQHQLAGAYLKNGQVEKAIELLEYVVKIREEALPINHPDRLASQHQLAEAYLENRQVEKATELLEYAVKIREEALPISHPSRLASQHQLAGAYLKNGQVEKAIELLEYVVKIREEALPINHPSRLASQHQLAGAYLENGQVEKAVELMEYVVKTKEALPTAHPSRLASQHQLAEAYLENEQMEKAIELMEYVVGTQDEALPTAHPRRLASQHQLAGAYLENGQVEKAIELLEYVVKIREEALPISHPSRLASQHQLAKAYLDNGQVEKAVELIEYVVKTEEALPIAHPERLASQHVLASAYHENGQVEKAIELMEHVVKIEAGVLTINDPNRIISVESLAKFKGEV